MHKAGSHNLSIEDSWLVQEIFFFLNICSDYIECWAFSNKMNFTEIFTSSIFLKNYFFFHRIYKFTKIINLKKTE